MESLPQSTQVDVPADEFQAAVVEESRKRPVVVDFWAPWCAPCRSLGPILERLSAGAAGAWLLARVNVDEAQDLASRFGVKGIPAVKAFRGGQVVAEFVGALPEAEVRDWLEGILPGPADLAFSAAQAALSGGDTTLAREELGRTLSLKRHHAGALMSLSELELADGHAKEALELVERISGGDADGLSSRIAAVRLKSRAPAGDLAELKRKVESDPADPQARLLLGRALSAAEDYPGALEQFLEVVHRLHRAPQGEEARLAMLELFEVIGARSDLSDAYRTKLSRELYR